MTQGTVLEDLGAGHMAEEELNWNLQPPHKKQMWVSTLLAPALVGLATKSCQVKLVIV